MIITLSPMRSDAELAVFKSGDSLTINGALYDFSGVAEGGEIDVDCPWVSGPVTRQEQSIRLTLVIPIGPKPSHEQAYPAPIIDPPDGVIVLPAPPPSALPPED